MKWYNTLFPPYSILEYNGIQYGVCRNFSHISRFRNLRQVSHEYLKTENRWKALETPNPITSRCEVDYYEVPPKYENRVDLIANELYGNAKYGWVICYFNEITDGFSLAAGTKIQVPKSIDSLFNTGEILQSVSATTLNLGEE